MYTYLKIQDVLDRKYRIKETKILYKTKLTPPHSLEAFIDSSTSPYQFIGSIQVMLSVFGKKFYDKLQYFEENLLYLNLNQNE